MWNKTIDEHRKAVRDTTLDVTAKLVAEQGLASVTMSRIAEETGIGRATLYKYFPDVDSILLAWHERHVGAHLHQLMTAQAGEGEAIDKLRSVLETFAGIQYEQHGNDISALLHCGEHVANAQQHLGNLVETLIEQAAGTGLVREDISPKELANYCLHALTAARQVDSKAAVQRVVGVTMVALRPTV